MNNISKIVFIISLLNFTNSSAANPPIIPVVHLKATDTNTKAEGTRASKLTLMMVRDPNIRTAKIEAILESGELQTGYPKWSGNGVQGSNGSLIANWSGTVNSTIVCEYAPGETKSINMIIAPISNVKIDIGSKDLNDYVDKVNKVIKLFAEVDDPPKFEGSIGGEFKQFVDYYNDGEKLGGSIGISGELALVGGGIEGKKVIPAGIAGVNLRIKAKLETIKVSIGGEFKYDEGKTLPWLASSGTVSGGMKGSLGADVILGLSTDDNDVGFVVSLDGSTSVGVTGTIEGKGRTVVTSGELSVGKLKAVGQIKVQFGGLGEYVFGEVSHVIFDGYTDKIPEAVVLTF